jgi:beta-glucosidase
MNREYSEETESILKSLTLEEKIRIIHGCGLFRTGEIKSKGIPSLVFSDGPMGVRQEFPDDSWTPVGNSDDYVSYCPSNTAIAASWNPQIAETCGEVLGEEARARGKDVILAPGVNIQRTPLCGRNFEYMGEDPCLASAMAVPLIRGIQKSDVAACVKHFALNSQETERLWVNVEADERTLREIYLPAFRAAVKEGGAECIMGAYNLFRGKHCCENKELNDRILRKEWGFDGVYVSDWGAVHDTKEAAETSLDVEMSVTTDFSQYWLADPLLKEVQEGRISEECVDSKVRHVLKLMFRLKMIDAVWLESEGGRYASAIPRRGRKSGSCNTEKHRAAIRKASEESSVLLKNEGGLLPLCPEKMKRILVIGDNAERLHADGGGSAEIKALYEISPLMGIKNRLGGNCLVDFARGYDSDMKSSSIVNWQETSLENRNWEKPSEEKDGEAKLREKQKRLRLRMEAVLKIRDADAVIVIGGLNHDFDVEGKDRSGMGLPYEQDQLIEDVLKERPDAVIVMKAGSPVSMDRWSGRARAILWDWYGGMEDGKALAGILFGDVNPSGKLPMSMPFRADLCPALILGDYPGRPLDEEEKKRMNAHLTENFREGIFVGYRYYEKFRIPVQFCFGHGLSYTRFTYSGLRIRMPENRNRGIFVYADIKNTGSVTGRETVQIYAGRKEASDDFPVKELKAFRKAELHPGETYTVAAELPLSAFSSWHADRNDFAVDEGTYCIYVGSSLEDIRLSAEVTVGGGF